MTTSTRMSARDEGSMILVLLAVIVLSLTSIAVVGTVITDQKTTRHEQRYNSALAAADGAAQEAAFMANSSQTLPTSAARKSETINGTSVSWYVDKTNAADWVVYSTGTANGVARTVTEHLVQQPLFPVAAFADVSVDFNGNNGSDSYPIIHLGDVGTNGVLLLKNNTTVDGKVVLYNYTADPNSARCQNGPCGTSKESHVGPKLDIASAVGASGFVGSKLAACTAAHGGTLPDFDQASFPGTAAVDGYDTLSDGTQVPFYCFNSFFADSQSFTVPSAVHIYVGTGAVTLGNKNHSNVNYPSTASDGTSPDSSRFQIFTTSANVSMYNQSNIAAAVYAPNATCGGVTSNAGTDFYGSMVCQKITNVGNWNFHYDSHLNRFFDGTFVVQHFAEPLS